MLQGLRFARSDHRLQLAFKPSYFGIDLLGRSFAFGEHINGQCQGQFDLVLASLEPCQNVHALASFLDLWQVRQTMVGLVDRDVEAL